jgi:hypothetical protein
MAETIIKKNKEKLGLHGSKKLLQRNRSAQIDQ